MNGILGLLRFNSLLGWVIVLTFVVLTFFLWVGDVFADYAFNTSNWPAATIKVIDRDGREVKEVGVCSGQSVNYIVKAQANRATGLKEVRVMIRKTGTYGNKQINFSSSPDVSGTINTTGMAPGQYVIYPYIENNPAPDEGDGRACEGSPYCFYFCGRDTAQGHIDTWKGKNTLHGTGGADAGPMGCIVPEADSAPDPALCSRELYRTSGNQAYCVEDRRADGTLDTGNCKLQGATQEKLNAMSCGENVVYRNGQLRSCELVACDRAGVNDHVFLTVRSDCAGGVVPSSPPSASAGGGPAPTVTDVNLPATSKAGQVQSSESNINLTNKQLNLSEGIVGVSNNSFIPANISSTLASPVSFARGKQVTFTKAVNVTAAPSGLVVSNTGVESVNLRVSPDTTFIGTDSWDGKLSFTPLLSTNAPAGYRLVGGAGVSVGSGGNVLVMSKPVSLVFENANCDWSASRPEGGGVECSMQYKFPGSDTWNNIPQCTSEVALDNSKLQFPNDCYIANSANRSVRVVAYHLTDFANFTPEGPVRLLSVLPQLCFGKSENSRMQIQLEMYPNPNYDWLVPVYSICQGRTKCDGRERLLMDRPILPQGLATVKQAAPLDSQFSDIKPGDLVRFRVVGGVRGTLVPELGGRLPVAVDKYWSVPVYRRVNSCEGAGAGITIEELIISPQER